MADLALVTADKLSLVESIQQKTLPAGVAITAGDMVTIDSTTGKWAKADADTYTKDTPLFLALKSVGANRGLTAIRLGVVDGFDLSALNYGQAVYLSKTAGKIATVPVYENEEQTVTIDATGGTFTLTFRGQTTGAIAYNATAATVQAALEALTTIGEQNVLVSGSAGGPFTIHFVNRFAGENVDLLTSDATSLTGGAGTAVVALVTEGLDTVKIGNVVPGTNVPLGTSYDKLLQIVMP